MTTPFDRNLLIVRYGGNLADLELTFILKIAEMEGEAEELSRDRSHRGP